MKGWTVKLGLVIAVSGTGAAQKYVPPPPTLTVDPCAAVSNPLLPKDSSAETRPLCPPHPTTVAPAGGKTAADEFPFPGETAKAPVAESPSSKAQSSTTGSAADQFPYPGERARSPNAMPEGDTKRYVPDAPSPNATGEPESSGSSSSSSSSSGGGLGGGEGEALPGRPDDASGDTAHARSHGRRALPRVSAVSSEDRVSEDLDVAKFYIGRGNFQAAYLRAKDATKLMPEDAETHFALAQAAEKLKRKDEAAAEYTLYLKLDPSGQKTAEAQRALSQLR